MKDEIKEILEMIQELINEGHDKSGDFKKLLDYITNLQEENRILKENAEHNDKVVDKAKWNEMIYKSRNEKAIDYINKHTNNGVEYLDIIEVKELKNILAGEDKDE